MFHNLKSILKKEGLTTAVGDEGGFAPRLGSNEEAIQRIMQAIEAAGYKPGEQIALGHRLRRERVLQGRQVHLGQEAAHRRRARRHLRRALRQVPDRHHRRRLRRGRLGRLEAHHRQARQAASSSWATTSSSPTRSAWRAASRRRSPTAILIKLNQIGSLTETLDTIRLATTAGYTSIISHRSGETEDAFIADLAVATNAGQIKTGSLSRSDRIAKYNQLLRIADELGDAQVYSGRTPFTKR